jgi:hypothetical protein
LLDASSLLKFIFPSPFIPEFVVKICIAAFYDVQRDIHNFRA